jgi:hypothetical protein
MRSTKNINNIKAGINLTSDEIIEFHASRLLLLIYICGAKEQKSNLKKINGLTKLAKLDFFIRYPDFFNTLVNYLNIDEKMDSKSIESRMIRFHYGPWDKRYYQVLPYLEARNLIHINKSGNAYEFVLSKLGEEIANKFAVNAKFTDIIERMKSVKRAIGARSGNSIKKLIYEVFQNEITLKELERII